jgi:hypothetical protein
LLEAFANMPKKNVPGPSVLASINFSAVVEPGRTLYTNGELALPTISTPPGATVKLSGCDFAFAIRMSSAGAAWTKLTTRATETARRRAFGLDIVKSPEIRCMALEARLDHSAEDPCHIPRPRQFQQAGKRCETIPNQCFIAERLGHSYRSKNRFLSDGRNVKSDG